MKTILFILLIMCNCLAAQNNTEMEIIYKKELKPHLKLEQVINDSDSTLKIELINHKINQVLVIDSTKFNKPSIEDLHSSNFVPPIYSSKILDAILIDSCLYIWQALEYHIYFDKIIFSNENHFCRERYKLIEMNPFHFLSISPSFKHSLQLFDNKVYFYVEAKRSGGGVVQFLGYYSLLTNKLFKYEHVVDRSNRTPVIPGDDVDFSRLNFESKEGRRIVKEAIEAVLRKKKRLAKNKEIEYLFCLNASSNRIGKFTYFFYKDTYGGRIKMIRYWHGYPAEFLAWLIDCPIEEVPIAERTEQ